MAMQAAKAPSEYVYQRHKPEESVLYKIIQENLETFLSLVREETGGLPMISMLSY
jgi:hypothetical protein